MGKGWMSLVAMALLMWVAADATWAQDLQPITSVTTSIRDFLIGPFATAMAGIAVAAVGYLYWIGRIDKDAAISVVIGIGIVFGSTQIVDLLSSVARR